MADSDFISINKQVKSFSSAPRFAPYDMVILDISDNLYVSSPYATLDDTKWKNRANGEHTFVYNASNSIWIYNGSTNVTTENLLSTYGIEVIYYSDSGFTDAPKNGDTIKVSKFTKEASSEDEEDEITVTHEMTRTGSVLETDCPLCHPSMRQTVANNILKEMYGYEYQPYTADGAIVNPLAELGDGVKAYGRYGGLYKQDITFSSLMSSNISAPGTEESESEFPYETEQNREYKRQLATVSATLTIQADQIAAEVTQRVNDVNELSGRITVNANAITSEVSAREQAVSDEANARESADQDLYDDILDTDNPDSLTSVMTSTFTQHATDIQARVTKEGGNTSRTFGWTLTDSNWTISNQSTDIFVADSTGIHVVGDGTFTGTITANDGQIGDFTIDHALYSRISSFGDQTQSTGVYLGTDGIQLGKRFTVDNYGNVSASSLEILGGSISIGGTANDPNFYVDSYGNLKANNGEFGGTVYAGNIQQRNANDTMNGSLLTPSTLNADSLLEADSLTGGGGAIAAGSLNGDSLITPGTIGTAGGGAVSAAGISAWEGGANFKTMDEQNNYTAGWVSCDHFACYGGVNGDFWYGSIKDAYEVEHSPYWTSRSVVIAANVPTVDVSGLGVGVNLGFDYCERYNGGQPVYAVTACSGYLTGSASLSNCRTEQVEFLSYV